MIKIKVDMAKMNEKRISFFINLNTYIDSNN